MDLELFEQKIFSQNGEDGVTIKLLELLYENDNTNKYYVEFGVEKGAECNTRILRENFNWSGLQMDGGNEDESINLRKEYITRENIIELFQKYKVPANINVISIDIDSNDFYCLHEIIQNYKCDIIICEYNSSHLPTEDKIVIYNKNAWWDWSNYFGVSLLALDKLGKKYNYSLIYCDKKGINCFLIHNDIIEKKKLKFKNAGDITKLYKPPTYGYGPNGGHPQDPYNRPYLTFEEALNDNHIFIGTSSTDYKEISLNHSYPAGTMFILNAHSHKDMFEINITGSILSCKRIDVKENNGWGHPHSGYIVKP